MKRKPKILFTITLTITVLLLLSLGFVIGGVTLYKNVTIMNNILLEIQSENKSSDASLFNTLYNVIVFRNDIFSSQNISDFKNATDKDEFIKSLYLSEGLDSNLYFDVSLFYEGKMYSLNSNPYYLDNESLNKMKNNEKNFTFVKRCKYDENEESLIFGIYEYDVYSLFFLKETSLYSFIEAGYESYPFIFDENDEIYIAPKESISLTSLPSTYENSSVVKIDGKKYIFLKNKMDLCSYFLSSLTIGNFISYESIFAAIDLVEIIVSILLGIAFIISGVITFIFARKITKPINQLSDNMSNLELDNLNEKKIRERPLVNEIAILENSYNMMITRIKTLMDKQKEDNKIQRKLELDSLLMQINPHFLYNALDNIAWMAKIEKNKQIEDFVISLAMFYRLSLHKGDKYIKVFEEVDIVKCYLNIEKNCFPNLFKFTIKIDNTIKEKLSLKLILQPFVENSIKYAFSQDSKVPGKISLNVKNDDNFVTYEIKDNGCGFNTSILEDTQNQNGLHGFGIKNVLDRLKLEYGNTYKFNIDSKIGEGTKVTISIPKSNESKN